jgi:DNA primase
MIDYYLALQIVQQAFKETLGQESYGSEERLTYIRDNGPVQYKTMQEAWGISKMAVSSWVSSRVRDGVLVFCNEEGEEFSDERDLKKAKSNGKAYVKVSDNYTQSNAIGLPTPFELTADPAWDNNGAMTKKYDLRLEGRSADHRAMPVIGEEDAALDETGDGFDSANGYDNEGIDEAIPDSEILDNSPHSWVDAIACAYSQ